MKYKNRYGDIIEAIKIDDNHYKLEPMLNLGFIRTEGFESNITAVDFSGGPMISINDDLGTWYPELKGKIVKSIKFEEGVILEV